MNCLNHFIKWPLLCALLSLALSHAALATIPLYQNLGVLDYTVPGNPPPVIDATAFDNENVFSVSYSINSPNVVFYEPMNTLFYTNNGTMTVNTPFSNINGLIFLGSDFGCGFQFDQQTSSGHSPASVFYNPNTIHCDSFLDGNGVFTFEGTDFFTVASLGECVVSATNIVNSGTVEVGVDGLIQFTGQNVDLTRGTLNIENLQSLFLGNSVGLNSVGAVGTDTNQDWDPSIELTATQAASSEPFIVDLTNSTAYFLVNGAGTTNVIVRAVFVQNTSPNVPYNVYIDSDPNTGALGFAPGAAHVEWVGSHIDPTTGAAITNYLYLTDDYVLGASTNVLVIGGVPDNFSFVTSPTPLLSNPIAAGFLNVFSSGTLTNPYAFMDAQLVPTTTPTNATVTNPNGALTNLPGRIQINASQELNLALAQISGQNYLALTATNQFDGNDGAQILAPYADINLGVTNGFLAITNLLQSAVPGWSGFIEAWSTRWLVANTNGVTTDFRVLLVGSSQLSPLTAPVVQNLKLHATNSIVISDVLNVIGSLSIDAQSLTLTTNGAGNGAGSFDGELNLFSGNILFPNALPNVSWLTNNGAIRTFNLAEFISSPTITTVTPGTPAVGATGTLAEFGTANVINNDKVTIGSQQYTFVTSLTSASNRVKIGTTFDGSLSNFIAAINHGVGSGSKYSSSTLVNTQVTAGLLANHAFTVTAITAGVAGNSIVTTETSSRLTWSHGTLAGGVDSVPGTTNVSTIQVPYAAFVNNGLLSDLGSTIFADYFNNSGTITNGSGSFILQSQLAVLTNGFVTADGNVSITADSLVVSNLMLQAGRSLTLQVTNLLTDTGPSPTNGNFWLVGGISSIGGLNLLVKPAVGDLLGTTITNIALPNKSVINTWAATNFGVSVDGYTNNAAIGRLILDAQGASSKFTFNGIGTNNALYVDYLELRDFATNRDANGNPTALTNNSGMVIYYAQAVQNGVSVADKLNHKNNDHLRWVPAYNGFFSSTNLVSGGITNVVNAALAQSTTIDSDGDGIPNASDPSPVFLASEVNFILTLTNLPPLGAQLQWATIPGATNYVFFKTNLMSANWLLLTNFTSATNVPPVGGWPITSTVIDPVNPVQPRFYRVRVDPNSILFNGP